MQVDKPIRNGPSPLFRQVAWQLERKIGEGQLVSGERLPDEHELARRFGVSRVTIRSALALLEEEALVIRRRGVGTFVAGPENWAASKASGGPLPTIGIILHSLEDFASSVLPAVLDEAASHGYALALGHNASLRQEEAYINNFLNGGVRGMLVYPLPGTFERTYDKVMRAGIAVVVFPSISWLGVDYVGYDESAITRLAVEHVFSLGHRRIGYVQRAASDNRHFGLHERLESFRQTCARLEVANFDQWTITLDSVLSNDEDKHRLQERLAQEDCPTAFVCYNDTLAAALCQIARAAGRRVPDDLSIVGVDNSPEAFENDVPLTSVDPGNEQLGRRATKLLLSRIAENGNGKPKSLTVGPPKLHARRSTCRVAVSTASPASEQCLQQQRRIAYG